MCGHELGIGQAQPQNRSIYERVDTWILKHKHQVHRVILISLIRTLNIEVNEIGEGWIISLSVPNSEAVRLLYLWSKAHHTILQEIVILIIIYLHRSLEVAPPIELYELRSSYRLTENIRSGYSYVLKSTRSEEHIASFSGSCILHGSRGYLAVFVPTTKKKLVIGVAVCRPELELFSP